MAWAAGALLEHDWPAGNARLQTTASQKVEALAAALDGDGKKDAAKKLKDLVAARRQRDLVIKLAWQGEADLDLRVKEPTGSVCCASNRSTVGGGTLVGDTLSAAEVNNETYLAAQAFSGEYEIAVERVWGKVVNDKAQLRVIRHQGTDQETEELLTVNLKDATQDADRRTTVKVKVKLADGRRTEAAYVPPASASSVSASAAPGEPVIESPSAGSLLNKLRDLADPESSGVVRGFHGGSVAAASPTAPADAPPDAKPGDRTLYQQRVSPMFQSSADVTAQAVLTADRRFVRVTLGASFAGVTGVQPILRSPVVPGGR
jgi:hypothetical protein